MFTVPSNTPGGDLKGFEGSYQQPFSFLDGFWGNFGVILNYTYVDSEVDYLNADGSVAIRTDLTGLSQNAYNATLYYEDDRFSARISGAYRDEYLTTVPGRNGSDVEGTADDVQPGLLGDLDLQRQPAVHVRGVEPHRRVPGPVGGFADGPAVVLPPHRNPVLPRPALQVLTVTSADRRPPLAGLPGRRHLLGGGGARFRYNAGASGGTPPHEDSP